MPLLLVAVLLGIVEGVTEFLPVSSTGHLILAEKLLPSLGEGRDELFRIVIQSGAMLAVLGLYRRRFVSLLKPAVEGTFSGSRGIVALALGAAPALLVGFVIRDHVHDWHTPIIVAIALAVGGVALLLLEALRGDKGTFSVDQLTPRIALGVGLFQCLALCPGVSRSAATIAGGMLLGLTRRGAAEFSFLLGAPILFAVSGYELVKHRALLTSDTLGIVAVGFVVSAIFAAIAVKAFTAILAHSTLRPFAWYRLALAVAVLALL